MFYSKTTGGFYDEEIHINRIPKDAVEITAEYHAELLEQQSLGKLIVADDKGFPRLQEPPAPTPEQLKEACKLQAKKKLADSDWSQQADVSSVLINKSEFDAYRAVVRDLFLRPVPNPTWPEEPTAVWSE